jgi:hypothetical protein
VKRAGATLRRSRAVAPPSYNGRLTDEEVGMDQIELGPVEKLRVTILMDNVTDPLIPDSGPVSRLSWPKALAESAAHVPVWFAAILGCPTH